MNAKKAKLIRRYARQRRIPVSLVKDIWKKANLSEQKRMVSAMEANGEIIGIVGNG